MIGAGVLPLAVQVGGTALFGAAFVFLWRRSGIVYYALWSAAWAAASVAALAPPEATVLARTFDLTSVWLLGIAAWVGLAAPMRPELPPLKALLGLPAFMFLIWAFGWWPARAALGSAIYLYNFARVGATPGLGGRVFRWGLLAAAAAGWLAPWSWSSGTVFAVQAVLALAGMAMWSESLEVRVRESGSELENMRREVTRNLDLDRLTGLLNRAALERRIEDPHTFQGVVAVCDMNDFKQVNDRYGHLAGDEILRNIGHLLRASIRQEDEAFRWGGDEFVILFHNQSREVAARRMELIEQRLREFRVRGQGALPISFSWGAAEAAGRPLRDVINEADRDMYDLKRSRRA